MCDTGEMPFVVRKAAVADAAQIARVHVAAWQEGYAGVMPDQFLANLDEERFATNWTQVLDEPPDEHVSTFVGELDGVIEAVATVGPFRDHANDEDPSGELHMLNCHPTAFGTGLAIALHAAGLDQLRSDGHHRAALWVVDNNPRARRFYEREGWTLDDARKEESFGEAVIVEVRYSISL